MGNQKIELALAFITTKPSTAAAVLEQQPMEDVALFLNNIPFNSIAPLLNKMLPQYTARLCALLEPEFCASFLSQMDNSLSAAIFRHTKKEVRQKILSLLPEKTKITYSLLLSYSESSAGAWMQPRVVTLPNDCDVASALNRIGAQENSADTDAVYIVDRNRHVQGWVRATTLLQTKTELSISSVMQKKTNVLYGHASLVSVSEHEGWLSHDALPVLNRNNQLVGILRHVDLRKGLHQTETNINVPKGSDPISNISEVYGESMLALFNTVGEMFNTKKY